MKRMMGKAGLIGTISIGSIFALGSSLQSARALTFKGKDAEVASGPNSAAAAADFDTAAGALGTVNIIDFEGATAGSNSLPQTINGVSISGDGFVDDRPFFNTIGGNTTLGGSQYIRTVADQTIVFDFGSNPVQAFGAFIGGLGTGLSPGEALLQYDNGTLQTFNLSASIGTDAGGVGFFGFTDAGASINSVAFISATGSGADVYSIDDVRYVFASDDPAVIPTPALLPSLMGLGAAALRKRKSTDETDEVA
ncbi:MAG: PTPA-CTERM sorting domain-containing protein [Cyanobacteria bacterium J06554_6]